MGIKDLLTFFKSKYPHLTSTRKHISSYKYEKIAVDAINFLYKYKCSYGDKWLVQGFRNLIVNLRTEHVHPIFVFDGKAPVIKGPEQESRREKRRQQMDKSVSLKHALEMYTNGHDPSDILKSTMNNIRKKDGSDILLGTLDTSDALNEDIDIRKMSGYIENMDKQIVNITDEDIQDLMEYFSICGIQYIQALGEAEKLCADLCRLDLVKAALTEDTDVLAYGCPLWLGSMTDKTVREIVYTDVLEALEYTPEQFTEFCIMCGCDYNTRMPKVGPVTAYKLLKTHGSLDNFPDTYPLSLLNYVVIKSMFMLPMTGKRNRIDYSTPIDKKKLTEFLIIHGYRPYEVNNDITRFYSKCDPILCELRDEGTERSE